MFNETSWLGAEPFAGRPECATADQICISRFPDADVTDGSVSNEKVRAARRGYLACMAIEGGSNKCSGSSSSYANPGATTYPIDVTTNSDNPNFVFQMPDFFKLADGSTNWFLLGGLGLLVFAVFMRVGR